MAQSDGANEDEIQEYGGFAVVLGPWIVHMFEADTPLMTAFVKKLHEKKSLSPGALGSALPGYRSEGGKHTSATPRPRAGTPGRRDLRGLVLGLPVAVAEVTAAGVRAEALRDHVPSWPTQRSVRGKTGASHRFPGHFENHSRHSRSYASRNPRCVANVI